MRQEHGVQPSLLMHSIPMELSVEDALVQGRMADTTWAPVQSWLADSVRHLFTAGATAIAMPCNTLQSELGRICRNVGLAHLGMLELTAHAAARDGARKALVLATSSTAMHDRYGRFLREQGVECIYPTARAQEAVSRHISDILNGTTIVDQLDVAAALHEQLAHVDAVVIGCTDLDADLFRSLVDVPVVDSLECLVAAIVERSAQR